MPLGREVIQALSGRSGAVVLLVLIALLVAGCSLGIDNRPLTTYLDTGSATLTRVSLPFVFFTQDSVRAAHGRDFLHVAPLQTNVAGQRRWWLWIGAWSSIDRGATDGGPGWPATISAQILVDGEPMELDATTAVTQLPGISAPPYSAPVTTAVNLYFPLSRSQVQHAARGTRLALRTTQADGESLLWKPWNADTRWTHFEELAPD
jgi:hypothetical protein